LTTQLTIFRNGRQVARGQLSTPIGRKLVEQFLATYMQEDLRGAPRVVRADGHNFTDVAVKCVHIVSAQSIGELQRVAGTAIDPLRFRPNLVIENAPAWSEFDLVGKTIQVGEEVTLEVLEPTQRCAATEVDPTTAVRDIALPALLERHWGHSDFGVYARVLEGGTLATGAALRQ